MFKILLVEDDTKIIQNLKSFLSDEGFEVDFCSGQKAAIEIIENSIFDLLLVDISLSDGNGYAVCAAACEKNIPVIFLTASGDEYNVTTGLDMGADDYINKPFRPRELISRIKNVLRRRGKTQNIFEISNLKVDTISGKVYKNQKEIFLSALEYRLLLTFLNNRGVVLTREKLLQELWDIAGEFVNDNTLTVYIKRLREKIEDSPQKPEIISTVRGLGYRAN